MMVIWSSPTIQNKNKTLTLRIGILLSNSMDVSTTWNTSSDLRAWGEEMYLSIRTNPKHAIESFLVLMWFDFNNGRNIRMQSFHFYTLLQQKIDHQLKKQTQLGWQRNGIKLLCYSSRSVTHWNQCKVSDRKRNSYIVILTARILQQLQTATVKTATVKTCNVYKLQRLQTITVTN